MRIIPLTISISLCLSASFVDAYLECFHCENTRQNCHGPHKCRQGRDRDKPDFVPVCFKTWSFGPRENTYRKTCGLIAPSDVNKCESGALTDGQIEGFLICNCNETYCNTAGTLCWSSHFTALVSLMYAWLML